MNRLRLFALLGLFLAATSHAAKTPDPVASSGTVVQSAVPVVDDAFLVGYLTGAIEKKFGWSRDSFRLEVQNGVATIVLVQEDADRRAKVSDSFNDVEGLQGVNVVSDAKLKNESKQPLAISSPTTTVELRKGMIAFPVGDVFRPILADPKQQQFFMSMLGVRSPTHRYTGWNIGYGENFGFVRWPGERPGEGWQIGLNAGLFGSFNWSTPSVDLINADYTFGLATSYRKRFASSRFRFYHQSSHLGDEFLIDNRNVVRQNLSYEAVDAIESLDWKAFRIYGGGNFLITHDPKELKRWNTQYGFEMIGWGRLFGFARPVAGVDVKDFQENDWKPSVSVKAGFELGKAGPGGRKLRLLGEYYHGFSPYGQFYKDPIEAIGVGVYLGL